MLDISKCKYEGPRMNESIKIKYHHDQQIFTPLDIISSIHDALQKYVEDIQQNLNQTYISNKNIIELLEKYASEGMDSETHQYYETQLKNTYQAVLKIRHSVNVLNNSLNAAVQILTDSITKTSDCLNTSDIILKDYEGLKNNYGLQVKLLNPDCIEIIFDGLITSKIFEKDDLLYQLIYSETKKTLLKNKKELTNLFKYKQLFLCVDQCLNYEQYNFFVRDFDKVTIGALINSVVRGAAFSDSSLSLNLSFHTYAAEYNHTKIYLLTPPEYFSNYMNQLQKKYIRIDETPN